MGNNVYGKGLYDGIAQGKLEGRKEAAITFLLVSTAAQVGLAIWKSRQEKKASSARESERQA